MQRSSPGAVAITLVTLAGCVAPEPARAPIAELAARASLDLQCPMPSLQLLEVDDRVKGVDGCGKRAIYVEVCQDASGRCAWWNDTSPALVLVVPLPPAIPPNTNGATSRLAPPSITPALPDPLPPGTSAPVGSSSASACDDAICGVR